MRPSSDSGEARTLRPSFDSGDVGHTRLRGPGLEHRNLGQDSRESAIPEKIATWLQSRAPHHCQHVLALQNAATPDTHAAAAPVVSSVDKLLRLQCRCNFWNRAPAKVTLKHDLIRERRPTKAISK